MKFVLAAVLCALSLKTVQLMPVAEPGAQSERLTVVPLEKSASNSDTTHVLRRETSESAAPEISVHREDETPEEHAKHAHLPTARLEDNAGKSETVKDVAEESKTLFEKVKSVDVAAEPSEKKEEALLKTVGAIEDVAAAKAAIAEIITPAETLAPIPAVPVASEPVESKNEAQVVEGKNAPTGEINSELKEGVKSEGHSASADEKIDEPQPIAKSSPSAINSDAPAVVEPIASVAAVAQSEPLPKEEMKVEPAVAENPQKADEKPQEQVKNTEDKTDRVTRGTEEAVPVESAQAAPAAPLTSVSASAPASAPLAEVAAAVAEPAEKLADEMKEEKTESPEKKLDIIESVTTSEKEQKSEIAKSAEPSLIVEASESKADVAVTNESEKSVKEGVSIKIESVKHLVEAKSASAELEAQPEAQPSAVAAAAPPTTDAKLEPVVDTIKVKSESVEASKESAEAVKVEDSSSSEEKSSEEDHSDEKLEKSVGTKSVDVTKDESKAEELPKPQEVKEIKGDE